MPLNLYDILNIPKNIILEKENNIDYQLSLLNDNPNDSLKYMNNAISIVNKFHSYFHFEQSYAYLIYALICDLMNDENNKKIFLEKAIFQDHINSQALDFRADPAYILSYDKCIKYEKDFLDFAVGKHKERDEVALLDRAIENILSLKFEEAERIFLDHKYNSHRYFLAQAIIHIGKDLEKAAYYIKSSAHSIETAHKQYHEFASNIYKKRSEIFNLLDKNDLAKYDLIKAEDLFPNITNIS